MDKEERDKRIKAVVEELFTKPYPTNKISLYTGKGGVREIAKTWFEGNYTWRNLRWLFKMGIVKPNRFWYKGRLYCGYKVD